MNYKQCHSGRSQNMNRPSMIIRPSMDFFWNIGRHCGLDHNPFLAHQVIDTVDFEFRRGNYVVMKINPIINIKVAM